MLYVQLVVNPGASRKHAQVLCLIVVFANVFD